jgi:hypothetical protein
MKVEEGSPTQVMVAAIAKKHLGLETLESRGRDCLDFHEHGVRTIKAALEAAFLAGAMFKAELDENTEGRFSR